MPAGNPAGYGVLPPNIGAYPAGTAPQPQFPLTSNLYNQQGNTIQTAIAAQQQQLYNQFNLPMQIIQLRTQLLENRRRANQNFGPNRARRAFLSGI